MERIFSHIKDKGENLYINHLRSVAKDVDAPKEKIVAMLHDLLEDTDYIESYLIKIGVPKELRDAVKSLTRIQTQSYKDYINNICINEKSFVLRVKLADLKNNMDISRISNPTKEDKERIRKRYMPAYTQIEKRLEQIKFENNDLEEFLKKQGTYEYLKSAIDKWGK
ncbi:GTP pyrophosphokinase [uncultured Clostridium sp.]|jgi:(p)ppGpp synthase/HD superfamily hydrolase|uniref:GTP pyrophosphokinase n=1 Tax=uncultured Clostridium sp. TaxID=59620 RepID=UPI0026395643|nr:GTP pyrophosphokinase [uncultured Clostridium sp.]